MSAPMRGLVSGLGLLSTAAFIGNSCLFNVEPGHRAIMFDRFQGIKTSVYEEGTHFKIPFIQRPIIMDVRVQPRVITTQTGTKDLQQVQLSLRMLYCPYIKNLPKIYQSLGTDYGERVLPSVGNEVLKAVVAQYNAEQLLTVRDQVSAQISEALTERCMEFGLILKDVSLTHLSFSHDFAKAIEKKQVAEQAAERAKFVVARKEQEREALITKSEGDAEAAKLVSDAIAEYGSGLIELRRIETAQKIADTLSKSRGNVVYLPNSGNVLLSLDSKQ